MKPTLVKIFCGAEALGALCCVGAYFLQDPLLWLLSLLLLLPGSLFGWVQLLMELNAVTNWSLLTQGLIALAANVFLFALAASLLRSRPKAS